jgi:hypothetical protein
MSFSDMAWFQAQMAKTYAKAHGISDDAAARILSEKRQRKEAERLESQRKLEEECRSLVHDRRMKEISQSVSYSSSLNNHVQPTKTTTQYHSLQDAIAPKAKGPISKSFSQDICHDFRMESYRTQRNRELGNDDSPLKIYDVLKNPKSKEKETKKLRRLDGYVDDLIKKGYTRYEANHAIEKLEKLEDDVFNPKFKKNVNPFIYFAMSLVVFFLCYPVYGWCVQHAILEPLGSLALFTFALMIMLGFAVVAVNVGNMAVNEEREKKAKRKAEADLAAYARKLKI